MNNDLLTELENKVEHALRLIELLRSQLDELEEENLVLTTLLSRTSDLEQLQEEAVN